MRMSQPRTGVRPLRAGIAVAATAAAVVAGTSIPAWAAVTGVLDTTTGPIGGGVSVKLTTTGDAMDPATLTAAKARFAASCDSTFGTTSTTKLEVPVSLDATSKDDATA